MYSNNGIPGGDLQTYCSPIHENRSALYSIKPWWYICMCVKLPIKLAVSNTPLVSSRIIGRPWLPFVGISNYCFSYYVPGIYLIWQGEDPLYPVMEFQTDRLGLFVATVQPRVERLCVTDQGLLYNAKLNKYISLRFPKKCVDHDVNIEIRVSISYSLTFRCKGYRVCHFNIVIEI